MKIGVTGATGQLGRLVVRGLLETQPAGDIIAVVRDPAKGSDLVEEGVQVRVAAYDNVAALEAALVGVDKLLLISSSEVGQRIQQHKNVIDAAKSAGVKHVIYTSAPQATTSALVLAPEHKATEEYLVGSGLDYTIVRHGWYTENYMQQVETSRKTGTLIAAVGEGRVASASRADFAAGDVAVLLGEGQEGKVYEFSGDHAWDFDELASAIADIVGRPVAYQPVDAPTLIGILKDAGAEEGAAVFHVALDQNIAAGLLSGTSGELSALIGRPTTPLKEALMTALDQGARQDF